jgi:hypothetical protein
LFIELGDELDVKKEEIKKLAYDTSTKLKSKKTILPNISSFIFLLYRNGTSTRKSR